jgi:hypothetical protein
MQQESLGREQFVCLEMMRDTQQFILVPSSKFVGYGSVDARLYVSIAVALKYQLVYVERTGMS